MNRIDLPEIEDQAWCPAVVRDALTDFLSTAGHITRFYDSYARDIADVMQRTGNKRIVDLCTGGGLPALDMLDALGRVGVPDAEAVLTDLYPNVSAITARAASRPHAVRAMTSSVDATNVPEDLTGFRTLFNAFHHFPPELAQKILEDAVRKAQPIACFELVERSSLFLVGWPFVPMLGAAAVLPFAGRMPAARFALTYVAPVIPAVVAWDGFASCMRSYSVPELRAMVAPLETSRYRFRVERRPTRAPFTYATCLMGAPV
jgi:hypothetical protein